MSRTKIPFLIVAGIVAAMSLAPTTFAVMDDPAPAAATAAPQTPAPAPAKKPAPQSYPERGTLWEKAITAYETKDKAQGPPAPGGILFVGSSSIVKWTSLTRDFPGLPVFGRGFGGSQIQDSTYYAGRIVVPYQPKTVVFYAGDNDLADGNSPELAIGDFQRFARKVHDALPDTKVIFIAIKPSPSRWRLEPKILAVNRGIQEWAATQKYVVFADIHPLMLGPDGQPRTELYQADRLHMTPAGYAIWTSAIAPLLK